MYKMDQLQDMEVVIDRGPLGVVGSLAAYKMILFIATHYAHTFWKHDMMKCKTFRILCSPNCPKGSTILRPTHTLIHHHDPPEPSAQP